jgi:ATP-dependent Lon protease
MVPLGGSSDIVYLEGHSSTYVGAKPGKFVDILVQAKCMNPIIYFDELDKIGSRASGQDIASKLIHLTDPIQNHSISDKYFSEIPLDMSRCMLFFSYNDERLVNPVLLDRLIKVETSGYTTNEKCNIVQRHMLRELLEEYGLGANEVKIPDATVRHVISLVAEEKGMRNLRRALDVIVGKYLMQKYQKPSKGVFEVTKQVAEEFLDGNVTKPPFSASNMMYI